MRMLDLFCGAGGAAMGYYLAGFKEIIGVDIKPQPNYPFKFHQADAMTYPLEGFEFVHASPPCQRWALGYNLHRSKYPALISGIRERLVKSGKFYVIENVPRAPLLHHAVTLCGGALGCANREMQLHRHRKFESNLPLLGTECKKIRDKTCTVTGTGTPSGFYYRYGNRSVTIKERAEVMKIFWMRSKELSEAVPPFYTRYIGRQVLMILEDE